MSSCARLATGDALVRTLRVGRSVPKGPHHRAGERRRSARVRVAPVTSSTSAPGSDGGPSSAASTERDDRRTPPTVRAPPGSHIYFAYGSNVNTKTMSGVRGVRPSASYPAVLEDYKLVFTVPGLPYVEPGFASVTRVREDDGQRGAEGADRGADIPGDAATPGDPSLDRYEREVHGVAYVIADDDWRFVLRSESGYAVERVTLRRCSDGAAVEAVTLVYPETDLGTELLPSARYLGLLTEGAEEWNLDAGWRRYLRERVRAYAPEGKELAGAIAAASLTPIGLAAAPLGLAIAARRAMDGGGTGDAAGDASSGESRSEAERAAEATVVDGFRAFQGFTWGVHNALWEPLFGSGANNDGGDGRRR